MFDTRETTWTVLQGRNCILADEMGLGKTVQCVSFLGLMAETCGVRGPFLVVVPLSTVPNWIKEFKKWVPMVSTAWGCITSYSGVAAPLPYSLCCWQ